jgi:hypothetical protein
LITTLLTPQSFVNKLTDVGNYQQTSSRTAYIYEIAEKSPQQQFEANMNSGLCCSARNGSASLLFVMKVMVLHFVSDSQ